MNTIRQRLNLLQPSTEGPRGLPIYYQGKLTHDLLINLARFVDELIKTSEYKEKVHKRIHHLTVELLQNANRHSLEVPNNPWSGVVMYSLDMYQGKLRIVVANLASNEQIEELMMVIDGLTACSSDERKRRFMNQLARGKLSPKGGAGLGIIDIARKSSDPMQSGSVPVGENCSLLYICAFVALEKINSTSTSECCAEAFQPAPNS